MTKLERAFEELQERLIELDVAWKPGEERGGLRFLTGDLIHHVCMARSFLDGADGYEHLDWTQRVLAREAFLSVIAFGQLVHNALEAKSVSADVLERARLAASGMLDALMPFVGRADAALRASLLEGKPFETVMAEMFGG
jgi:hypothetical protein